MTVVVSTTAKQACLLRAVQHGMQLMLHMPAPTAAPVNSCPTFLVAPRLWSLTANYACPLRALRHGMQLVQHSPAPAAAPISALLAMPCDSYRKTWLTLVLSSRQSYGYSWSTSAFARSRSWLPKQNMQWDCSSGTSISTSRPFRICKACVPLSTAWPHYQLSEGVVGHAPAAQRRRRGQTRPARLCAAQARRSSRRGPPQQPRAPPAC